jgi:hypothetical protein
MLIPTTTRTASLIHRPPRGLQLCSSALRRVAAAEGLAPADLVQLLGNATEQERETIGPLLEGEEPKCRLAAASALAKLEDALGTDLGSNVLCGRWTRLGQLLGDLVGFVIGPFCGYLVIAGLIEGDSLLLGNSMGPLGLLLLLVLLALLGLYEALHTSATQLKIADLGAVAERYPRAAHLHRRFRTDAGLSRFLAGRQMVVIITVFFCSPLASFPNLHHWPLTNVPLPGIVGALVTVGMPGALFVYWFGQIIPQFLATRHAVALTNSRIVGLAFKGAFALESLGVSRPAEWIAGLDRRSSTPIPSSAALRWQQAAREVDGYGVVGIVREWRVGADTSRLNATTSMRVYKRAASFTDGSMLLPGAPTELVLQADAVREEHPLSLQASEHLEEILPTGDRRFHKPILPAVGSFLSDDTVRVSMAAIYPGVVGRDLVVVDRPARFVLFRVSTECLPSAVPPARLRSYRIGDGLGDIVETGPPLVIEPEEGPEGRFVINALVAFPAPGTLHTLDWEVLL